MTTGIIISIAVFFLSFVILKKIDKSNKSSDECRWKNAESLRVAGFVLIAALLAASLSSVLTGDLYAAGCILAGYIAFCAYTDFCDRYIYAVPFILFLIIYIIIYIHDGGSAAAFLTAAIQLFIIYVFCCRIGHMGTGDMYVIAAAVFMLPPMSFAFCIIIAVLVFILFNFRGIDWKKLKLKSGQAFIPALAIGMITAGMITALTVY